MKTMGSRIKTIFTENLSFKFVSLVIALILWVSILGRRDFIVTKVLEVDFVSAPTTQVAWQSADKIKVKVSGPRAALRKFIEGGFSTILTIDLSQRMPGKHVVSLDSERFDIPFGSKLVTVQPREIEVEIRELEK
jgi:YbbR domain-containing protein